jgi:hypothetical protein
MWNLKTAVMPVIIRATGTISTSFRKSETHTHKSQHQGTTENILGKVYVLQKVKGKATPLQAPCGPEGG